MLCHQHQFALRLAKALLLYGKLTLVKDALQNAHPGLQVELVTMVTKGDIILDTPLAKSRR